MSTKAVPREVKVSTSLTRSEKQVLQRRAKALGMSVAELIRVSVTKPDQIANEILAREWIAVALLLQKLQSSPDHHADVQQLLQRLKDLICRTFSDESEEGR